MLAADVFRSKLHATTTAIELWLGAIDAAAEVEATSDSSWRIDLKPHAETACPVELILRVDQCFDLVVAAETYEDLPIEDFALFPKLLRAIAEGRVITRTSSSAVTGLPYRVQTLVTLSDGTTWTGSRQLLPLHGSSDAELVHLDRHYVPYQNASGKM